MKPKTISSERLSPLGKPKAMPVLQRVEAHGRLDGLFFELNVRQFYRNTSPDVLEVVYTFPLATGAVLLGMEVELAGKRLAGMVVERVKAAARYEEAMASGDAPIMLERSGDGIYTANLGNIKPGEELVVAYRYGQLMHVEQGLVRLSIPTTIAPRYGDPLDGAGLQPHQVPYSSLTAEYGLTLDLMFEGAWTRSVIACPTHPYSTETVAGSTVLRLGRNAWLDRDVVVTLQASGQASLARSVPDGDQQVIMATFQPATAGVAREAIDIKLLVDCSGSMAGDSIASAKSALVCIADKLGPDDRFTFSRFGNTVSHGFKRLTPARTSSIAILQVLIETTEANLGGTEMQAALSSTIALAGTGEQADILLITDGEVWNVDPMIAAAAASRHRLFIVGVGAAPVESTLRRLAEASGGACEFATPGENLRMAVDRMFARIRQPRRGSPRLVWRSGEQVVAPAWVAGLPRVVFGGDTVHVFAGFAGAPPTSVSLEYGAGDGDCEIAGRADVEPLVATGDGVPRIAAAARLPLLMPEQRLALALRYQLVTDLTNLIVVHQRADSDKVVDMAQLHTVPSMLAAGWGGAARVGMAYDVGDGDACMSMAPPAPARSFPSGRALFRLRAAESDTEILRNDELLQKALALLALDPSLPLGLVLDGTRVESSVAQVLDALATLGVERETAWLIIVRLLADRSAVQMGAAVEEALESRLAAVSTSQWRGAVLAMEGCFPANDPAV